MIPDYQSLMLPLLKLFSDGIQELCEKAGVYPCILDAAIFSSFDNNQWTDENTIF